MSSTGPATNACAGGLSPRRSASATALPRVASSAPARRQSAIRPSDVAAPIQKCHAIDGSNRAAVVGQRERAADIPSAGIVGRPPIGIPWHQFGDPVLPNGQERPAARTPQVLVRGADDEVVAVGDRVDEGMPRLASISTRPPAALGHDVPVLDPAGGPRLARGQGLPHGSRGGQRRQPVGRRVEIGQAIGRPEQLRGVPSSPARSYGAPAGGPRRVRHEAPTPARYRRSDPSGTAGRQLWPTTYRNRRQQSCSAVLKRFPDTPFATRRGTIGRATPRARPREAATCDAAQRGPHH